MVNIKQMVAGLVQSEGSLAEVFQLTCEVVMKSDCNGMFVETDQTVKIILNKFR